MVREIRVNNQGLQMIHTQQRSNAYNEEGQEEDMAGGTDYQRPELVQGL